MKIDQLPKKHWNNQSDHTELSCALRPQVLLRCYENMKADLPGTVRTIAQFLSIELDQALLALVVEQPKLRYLVGEDAKRVVAARQAMTDEARVDFEQEMSLDDDAERYF